MGGSGAKNKRKQQRQQQESAKSDDREGVRRRGGGPSPRFTNHGKYQEYDPSSYGRNRTTGSGWGDRRFEGQQNVNRQWTEKAPKRMNDGVAFNNDNKKKSKTKIKKPKHLKRKLESIDENDPQKAKLIQEMQEWERKKHGQQHASKNEQNGDNHNVIITTTKEGKKQKCEHPTTNKSNSDNHKQTQHDETPTTQTAELIKDKDDLGNKKNTSKIPEAETSQGNEDDFPRANSSKASKIEDIDDDNKVDVHPKDKSRRSTGGDGDSSGSRRVVHDDSNDASSRDEMETTEQATAVTTTATTKQRQRGKRRRGRKDTSKKIEETTNAVVESKRDDDTVKPVQQPGNEVSCNDDETKEKHKDLEHEDSPPELREDTDLADTSAVKGEKTPKKSKSDRGKDDKDNDGRYCIGRKPVTDFVIGQKYKGTVVYVKPFGVFLDIGCHSDAFCHVSRLRDDYVESPESIFRVGDVIDHARVVEIDRQHKRITVSLQSDARRQDEVLSVEARKERRQQKSKKHKRKDKHGKHEHDDDDGHVGRHTYNHPSHTSVNRDDETGHPFVDGSGPVNGIDDPRVSSNATTLSRTKAKERQGSADAAGADTVDDNNNNNAGTADNGPESEMTPKELKRARKLARRAARREEQEEEQEQPKQ